VAAPGGQPLLVELVYIEPTLTLSQALKQLFIMKWVTGCRISPRGTCVKSTGLNAQKRWKLDFRRNRRFPSEIRFPMYAQHDSRQVVFLSTSAAVPRTHPLLMLKGHARTMHGMWAWFMGLLRSIDGIRVSIPTDFCVDPVFLGPQKNR
jgi:hypothetical protein